MERSACRGGLLAAARIHGLPTVKGIFPALPPKMSSFRAIFFFCFEMRELPSSILRCFRNTWTPRTKNCLSPNLSGLHSRSLIATSLNHSPSRNLLPRVSLPARVGESRACVSSSSPRYSPLKERSVPRPPAHRPYPPPCPLFFRPIWPTGAIRHRRRGRHRQNLPACAPRKRPRLPKKYRGQG